MTAFFHLKNSTDHAHVKVEKRRGHRFFFTDGWDDFICEHRVKIGALMKFEITTSMRQYGYIHVEFGWTDEGQGSNF